MCPLRFLRIHVSDAAHILPYRAQGGASAAAAAGAVSGSPLLGAAADPRLHRHAAPAAGPPDAAQRQRHAGACADQHFTGSRRTWCDTHCACCLCSSPTAAHRPAHRCQLLVLVAVYLVDHVATDSAPAHTEHWLMCNPPSTLQGEPRIRTVKMRGAGAGSSAHPQPPRSRPPRT